MSRLSILVVAVLSFSFSTALWSHPEDTFIKGVWMHPGNFGAEKDVAVARIRTTLDSYQRAGINTLMVLVKATSGLVYYESSIAQRDTAWHWDFFGTLLTEAQKRSMVVHPWFCVFTESSLSGQIRQHPEWLIRSKKGEIVPVVNPAIADVRRYETSLMKEIVDKYHVDWIHLDYIRFPCDPTEDYFSFDPETRQAFQRYSGQDPLAIKAMDSGNIVWNAWIEWNAGKVTQFVRELKDELHKSDHPVRVSAAVFPDAGNAKVLIGQDWQAWARDGLIEMLCPMLYTNNLDFFSEFTQRAVHIAQEHCQVCIGIGIGTSHNQNTPEGMQREIAISRNAGANGVVFFSSSSLDENFLRVLSPSR